MNRRLPVLVLLALAGVTLAAFPPVRLHSLKAMRATQAEAAGQASASVETLWSERLLPAAERAADAAAVVAKINADPKAARATFGRTVGVSDAYFLFLRGVGRVVKADEDAVTLSLAPEGDRADVVLPLGFIFGNAVRDATGLLDASDYPNAQDFNDLSAKLNEIVEKRVLPQLRAIAKPGARIEFAGCAEVADESTDLRPLSVVPVLVRVP